jgi:hypothetical protein
LADAEKVAMMAQVSLPELQWVEFAYMYTVELILLDKLWTGFPRSGKIWKSFGILKKIQGSWKGLEFCDFSDKVWKIAILLKNVPLWSFRSH